MACKKRNRSMSSADESQESEDSSNAAVECVTIDSRGDIEVEVKENPFGADEQILKSYTVRVSSKVLSLASKPFEAMFSGRYLEGLDLSVVNPTTIQLPEDDAVGIICLFKILHHTISKKDTLALGPIDVVKAAVAAHKYDCIHATFSFLKEFTMAATDKHHRFKESDQGSLQYCALITSYLIDDEDLFNRAASNIVRGRFDMIESLGEDSEFIFSCPLPSTIWILLSKSMDTFRLHMIDTLFNCDHARDCPDYDRLTGTAKLLTDFGLEYSASEIDEIIRSCQFRSLLLYCDFQKHAWDSMLIQMAEDLAEIRDGAIAGEAVLDEDETHLVQYLLAVIPALLAYKAKGMCLKCVKTGEFHPKNICGGCETGSESGCKGCDGTSHKIVRRKRR